MSLAQEKTTAKKISFWTSLRGRVTWQVLLVSLIPLIIISAIFLTMLNQAIDDFEATVGQIHETMANEVVGTKLQTLAEETMVSIDTYMIERIHDIQDWASTPIVINALQEAVEKVAELDIDGLDVAEIEEVVGNNRELLPNSATETYLQDRLVRNPAFKEVFFTDGSGYNVAVSNPTSDFVQSDEEWWQIAWDRGIFISEITYDESAQTYVVDIAIRISHPDTGRPLGVMKASLDIAAIQTQISNIADSTAGAEAVLLEAAGYRIADSSSNHSPELIMTDTGNLLNLDYTPTQVILDGEDGGFLLAQPGLEQTGETAEIGYAASAGTDFYTDVPGFNGFGWHVLFMQSTAVAFQALEPIANLQLALQNLQSSTTVSVLVVGVLAAFISIVFAFFMASNISKPIVKLNQMANKVAAGYLDETIDVQRRDEIGSLAESLDAMTGNLRDLIGQLQQGAAQVAGASQQLNLAAEQTGQAAQQVAQGTTQQTLSATEVTNNVEQIAHAAEGVARGSQEQAQAVQKTSVLINEMAGVVDEVEKITGSALETDIRLSPVKGKEEETIRQRTAIAVQKVKEMGVRSKEIGRIVETIDDIADKTDMLALNAAVEAARAGEHGRGFAVVAEQVRKLSEDSKEATRDINGLIERVQDAVNEAVLSAEGAASLAEQISQAMAQLKQKSEGVVVAIESVSTVVEENTAVSEEMAANSQEVTDAMGGVVSIAEENSASAEEMSAQIEEVVASAEELAALAEQLKEATAQFQLGEAQPET